MRRAHRKKREKVQALQKFHHKNPLRRLWRRGGNHGDALWELCGENGGSWRDGKNGADKKINGSKKLVNLGRNRGTRSFRAESDFLMRACSKSILIKSQNRTFKIRNLKLIKQLPLAQKTNFNH